MFRKDFKVKTNVKSKNSEKRKIINDLSNYYKLDSQLLSNLFGKSDLNKIKVECHDDTIVTIYNFDHQPLFFEYSKVLIPTVYCLWIIFDILPSFKIHEETTKFIINGSDLMIPGIIVPKPLNEKSYGTFNKRELYTINTNVSRAPIAIGMTNMDSYDFFMCGGRGKAVNVLHCQGDSLWAFGKKNLRPEIKWQDDQTVEDDEDSEEINEIESESNGPNDTVAIDHGTIIEELEEVAIDSSSLNDGNNNEISDMDELLEKCFLHALKCSLKDKSLPITLNMFYAKHVLHFCPEGTSIEIKKTSYKKFGVFMKEMAAQSIITLKEISKGVDTIKSIDRSHDKLRFTPSLVFQEEKKPLKDSEGEYVFPQIDEVYFVTDKSYNILKYHGYKKADVISPKDTKSIITEYVNKNNLNGLNKDMVTLDSLLKSCCLNLKETITELSWKTLFDRIYKNMTPGLVMRFPSGDVTLKNPKKPKIKIQTFKRNNKMVTRIEGEDKFCLDSKKLCYEIQQSVGCSCGLVSDKTGVVAVQAQGDQRERVIEILTERFKVPLSFIEDVVIKKSK